MKECSLLQLQITFIRALNLMGIEDQGSGCRWRGHHAKVGAAAFPSSGGGLIFWTRKRTQGWSFKSKITDRTSKIAHHNSRFRGSRGVAQSTSLSCTEDCSSQTSRIVDHKTVSRGSRAKGICQGHPFWAFGAVYFFTAKGSFWVGKPLERKAQAVKTVKTSMARWHFRHLRPKWSPEVKCRQWLFRKDSLDLSLKNLPREGHYLQSAALFQDWTWLKMPACRLCVSRVRSSLQYRSPYSRSAVRNQLHHYCDANT